VFCYLHVFVVLNNKNETIGAREIKALALCGDVGSPQRPLTRTIKHEGKAYTHTRTHA